MVLRIIEYIGKEILSANPYIDVFGANCITTKDGRVTNFIGAEKSDFGPSDISGIGSYARIEPTIEYSDIVNKKSSCKQDTRGSIKFRLVVFQVNAVDNVLNPAKLENKIWGDLRNINFNDYVGNESQIVLNVDSSNLDFSANFRQEVGKDYEVGADAIIIALNCTLSWNVASDNCEVCSVSGISSLCIDGVNIVDDSGNVVATVECGATYNIGSVVPSSRTITINGVTFDLSQNRSWNVGAGGGETLAQTLVLGNSTGGTSMIVDDGDSIRLGTSSFTQGILSYDNTNFRTLLIHSSTGDFLALNDAGGVTLKAPTGKISSDGIGNAVQLDWSDAGNQMQMFNLNGQIGVYTANSYIYHDTNILLDAPIYTFNQLTASTVPYLNANKELVSSAVTPTQLSYLDATSSIQTQLNGKEPTITAGTTAQYWRGDKSFQTLDTLAVPENTNLYFTTARVLATALTGLSIVGATITSSDSVITAFGKLQNQINGILGGAIYQGVWNATTNSPTLTSGAGTKGYYYVVSVAGSTNLDGVTDWKIGDWAIFNGTAWEKVDNTDAVSSVNGAIGAVTITTTGTLNRISVSGGTGLTPTIDIDAGYVGQTSITTLGTIGTGTWQSTAVGSIYGGTGLSSVTANRILYATATNTWGTSASLNFNGTGLQIGNGTMYGTVPMEMSRTSLGSDFYIRNNLATASSALFLIDGIGGSNALRFQLHGSTFASTGITVANTGSLFTQGASIHLNIGTFAAAETRFWTSNIQRANIDASGFINLGTYGSPSAQRLVTIGDNSAWVSIGSITTSSVSLGFYASQTTPSGSNYSFNLNASSTNINGPTTLLNLQVAASTKYSIGPNTHTLSVGSTTLSNINWQLTCANSTVVTASAAIPKVLFTLGTAQWSTGAGPTIQAFYRITQPTASAVGASTFPINATVVIDGACIAGTNMTQTLSAGLYIAALASVGSAGTAYGAYINTPSGGTLNYALGLNGDLSLVTAGNGILIKEGTNATMGLGTLVGGTVTISTTKVTANSRIVLTGQGGNIINLGSYSITARTAGTSFVITSSNVLDTNTVAWVIIEPT